MFSFVLRLVLRLAIQRGFLGYSIVSKHLKSSIELCLTVPQFCIYAIQVQQLAVRPCLHYMAILQHQDLVAVIDSTQTMRNKHARAALILENAVDVLQEGLFCVGVESGGLRGHLAMYFGSNGCQTYRFVKEQKLWIL